MSQFWNWSRSSSDGLPDSAEGRELSGAGFPKNWSKENASVAWGAGGYYARIFLNVSGREPEGAVPPDAYESVRDELARRLVAIPDPEGRPLPTKVFKPEEIYRTCNGVPPDLIVYFGDLLWRSVGAVGAGGILLFAVGFFLLGMGPLLGIGMGAAGLAIGYIAPEFWLSRRVRARQHAILLQLPDALDLLTISVRAGLGFDGAMGKVVEKMRGPLVDEYRRALAEIRVGKARREALRDIIPRTEVPALTNFIGAVIQAEQLGVSISKVLQVQSEQLRTERRQRAEEMTPPRRRSRCSSRWSGASSRRSSSSSWARRSP